ncbi:MAG: LamG domain-containing protein [Gammaproteobacteria bacterium]|nr:LamG domain-containing protein [Gammaproteobacteria bacterium]MBU1624177.1 LamG domain-containing protein [Gammaproteobacteria bacterium]MBU1981905.1 LamG domain-containing protein [Gammaproteobacteria bacterium]
MTRHAIPSRHASATFAPSAAVPLPSRFGWPLLLGAMLLAVASLAQAATDTYTTTGTWTAPAGVTSVDVQVWGGGGGGGGGEGDNSDGGGGGGGGAYSRTTAITVVPGTTYTVTVGAAGTAGAMNGTGGTGGDSWFINTTTILAKGGTGGSAPVSNAGGVAGAGGTAAAGVGAVKYSGGNGGTGRDNNTGRGGPGGSSAGTAANGTSGPATWNTCTAAAAPAGGGIGGNGGCANSQNGFAPASGNGGGGGGAAERNTTGGAGAAGLVSITYTLPASAIAEYRMDESSWNGTAGEVVDSIAGNNGTGMGAVTTAASAGIGQGICNVGVFDGANDYVAVPTLFTQLNGTFTLSVWLNTTQLGNNIDWQAPGITGVEQNGGQDDIFLGWLDAVGHIGFNVKNDTSFKSSTVVSDGNWHHVAFTRDMATGVTQIYVDGVLEGTRTQPTGLVGNSFDGIGRITNTSTPPPLYFAGKLDEYKVFSSVLSASAIAAGYNNELSGKNWDGSARTCASLLDHVSIDAPTTAMAFSTVPVVISPHTAAHDALTGHTITLSTSTGAGDWSSGGGSGTLTPGAANSGQASYTFGAGESSVSLYFTYQAADTVNIYVADSGGVDLLANTPIAELSNTINYSQPIFAFTDSVCVHNIAFGAPGQTCAVIGWSPQVAGVDVTDVYITTLSSGVPTRLHPVQVRTRDMAFALSCHDPATHAGVQATFSGVTLPLCQANGATPASWSSSTLTASFPGGTPSAGPFSFNYADVGKVDLWMRNSAATAQLGASGPFVVAPHHFGVSAVTAGPIKAGNDFSATVTAYNSAATATPNFGKETTPESVTITFSKCQPSGVSSSNGTFSLGATPAFTNGATTITTLNWSEVGNGDLTATLSSGSYLLSGLTASGNTSASGTVCQDAGGAAIAGTVGTFVPHHFNTYVIAPMTVCPTGQICPVAGWAYSGQPFTVNVTAANASDAITVNYDGTGNTSPNFAKAVTLQAWDAAGSTVTQNPPSAAAGALSNSAVPATSFQQGSTILGTPATPVYTFATTPTAPTDIYLRAADADATSLRSVPATSIEGGVKIASGRIKISNNYGSELLPLTMNATAQFYGGSNWLTSNTDSATTFDSALSTAGGNVVISNLVGMGGAVAINAPTTDTMTDGVRAITLNAPGVPGSVDLSLNAPSYLLTGSNGAAVDPSIPGRATFGIYKGNDAFIYQREAY